VSWQKVWGLKGKQELGELSKNSDLVADIKSRKLE
jgi:hypothetical protein